MKQLIPRMIRDTTKKRVLIYTFVVAQLEGSMRVLHVGRGSATSKRHAERLNVTIFVSRVTFNRRNPRENLG